MVVKYRQVDMIKLYFLYKNRAFHFLVNIADLRLIADNLNTICKLAHIDGLYIERGGRLWQITQP